MFKATASLTPILAFFFFSWPKWVFGYTCLKYFPSSSSGGHALWRRIPDLQSPLVFVQTRPHALSSGASSAHPPGVLPALSLVLGWGPSVFPSRYPARPPAPCPPVLRSWTVSPASAASGADCASFFASTSRRQQRPLRPTLTRGAFTLHRVS